MLIFLDIHDYYQLTDVSKGKSSSHRHDTPIVVVKPSPVVFAWNRPGFDVELIMPYENWKQDKHLGSFDEKDNAVLFAKAYEQLIQ